MNAITNKVKTAFQDNFNQKPIIVRSPGRVNLIGEHTDYNGGLVLPAAIDKAAYLAFLPSDSETCTWISLDLDSRVSLKLNQTAAFQEQTWANYILGVVLQFKNRGFDIQAFNCVLAGDIPIGSGMSSSAALESALAFAINQLNNCGLDTESLAKLVQQAENEFIGVKCGIMDMFVSIHGKANHVLKLDCQSLAFEYLPISLGDYKIVLFDTGIKHNLAESEYNLRRQQCEEGLAFFKQYFDSTIQNLTQVPLAWLQASQGQISPLVYQRCQYVIEENQRILAACQDLKNGNLVAFGVNMTATHQGLRHNYAVSCLELDILVDAVWHNPAVLGARMMGGGFGGCTINLVKSSEIDQLFAKLSADYKEKTNLELKMYSVITANGTEIIA